MLRPGVVLVVSLVALALAGCGGGGSSGGSSSGSGSGGGASSPCPTESAFTSNTINGGSAFCTPSPLLVPNAELDASVAHEYTVQLKSDGSMGVGAALNLLLQWPESPGTGHNACGGVVTCVYVEPGGQDCSGAIGGSFVISDTGAPLTGRIKGTFAFTLGGAGACSGSMTGSFNVKRQANT